MCATFLPMFKLFGSFIFYLNFELFILLLETFLSRFLFFYFFLPPGLFSSFKTDVHVLTSCYASPLQSFVSPVLSLWDVM